MINQGLSIVGEGTQSVLNLTRSELSLLGHKERGFFCISLTVCDLDASAFPSTI